MIMNKLIYVKKLKLSRNNLLSFSIFYNYYNLKTCELHVVLTLEGNYVIFKLGGWRKGVSTPHFNLTQRSSIFLRKRSKRHLSISLLNYGTFKFSRMYGIVIYFLKLNSSYFSFTSYFFTGKLYKRKVQSSNYLLSDL